MRASLSAGPIMCAALSLPAFAQDEDSGASRSIEARTAEIKQTASPSVVSITVTTRGSALNCLAFPGLRVAPNPLQPEKIEGTGFFVASRGLLVTTRDLVCDAARVEVRFLDGTTCGATLLGCDGPYQLAVLRTVAPAGVDALPHTNHVEARASTIGWLLGATPPREKRSVPSVDVQVASVKPAPEHGAIYDRFLYAPLSLARGGAGGPLLGDDGRLLGMAVGSLVLNEDAAPGVRDRLPRATLFVRGDDVAEAARQIAAGGAVSRPMLGTMMCGQSNRIETCLAGGPAEAAGLAEGDAIVGVGAVAVANYADLARALLRRRAGEPVRVTVERAGERLTKSVALTSYRAPEAPTTPPIAGAVIEVSLDAAGSSVFTFVELDASCPAAKAGAQVGDKLVTVDGFPTWRFLRRHGARAAARGPAKIEIEREGRPREIALATE